MLFEDAPARGTLLEKGGVVGVEGRIEADHFLGRHQRQQEGQLVAAINRLLHERMGGQAADKRIAGLLGLKQHAMSQLVDQVEL